MDVQYCEKRNMHRITGKTCIRKWTAVGVILSMILSVLSPAMAATEATGETTCLDGFKELPEDVRIQSVKTGTELSQLELPDKLTGIIYGEETGNTATPAETASGSDAGKTRYVAIRGVTWESDPIYAMDIPGVYIFTANLPFGDERYSLDDEGDLPQIEVTVEEPTGSDRIALAIDQLPALEELYENALGEADPDYTAWLAEMEGLVKDVRQLMADYEALAEAEQEEIGADRAEKLGLLAQWAETMQLVMPVSGDRSGNWTDYAADGFAGGDGSEEDPYRIENAAQLAYMATEAVSASSAYVSGARSADKYYKITADTIDLSAHYWVPISIFAGNLDGSGCTITGMYCKETRPSSGSWYGLGFFGRVSPEYSTDQHCEIKNLNFSDCTIQTEDALYSPISQKAGILAGEMLYGVSVSDCSVEDSSIIIAEEENAKQIGVGGLIGYFGHNSKRGFTGNCKITDCHVSGITLKNTGGMIGGLIGGTGYNVELVKDCSVLDVDIESSGYPYNGTRAGGLIGDFNVGQVKGIAAGNQVESGVIVGRESSNSGYIGGLIGRIYADSPYEPFLVEECYSGADVTGHGTSTTGGYGGLVGAVPSGKLSYSNETPDSVTLSRCYASGNISGGRNLGGLAGSMMGTVKGCYAEGDVTNSKNWTGGLIGAMEGMIIDSYATGDVEGCYNTGGLAGSFAGRMTGCYAEGDVTAFEENSGGLAGYVEPYNWFHSGSWQDSDSEIFACYATGNVDSSSYNTGGLAGYVSNVKITESYAAGSVIAWDWNTGGLCGYAEKASVRDCYAMGAVEAAWEHEDNAHIGGLVGKGVICEISNSYAKGTIALQSSEDSTAGGLAGYFEGTSFINCYFDKETSGTQDGVGGSPDTEGITPVLTKDMTRSNQAYYLNEDGVNTMWAWDPSVNDSYPYLGSPAVQTLSYQAEVQIKKDGEPWPDSGKTIRVSRDNGASFPDLSDLEPADYRIYDGSSYTEKQLLIQDQDVVTVLDYYTVTFYDGEIPYGEQTAQAPQILLEGARINRPENPVRGGYGFTGWYQDKQLTRPCDFEAPVTGKQDLYAGWEALPDGNQETVVEVAPGSYPVASDNLDRLFKEENLSAQPDGGVTREDAETVKAGGSVIITLKAEQKPSESPETKVVLDLTVIKEVMEYGETSGTETRLKQLPSLITVRVKIPGLSEKQDIQVSRIHEGQEQKLPYDDEWFEVSGDELILYVRRFSEYFITFSNKAEEPDPGKPEPGGQEGGHNSSSDHDGDHSATGRWILDAIGWWYSYPNGTWPSNGWYFLYWDGAYQWYHFDRRGYLETGWFTDADGNRYYLHPLADGDQGYMYTGWHFIDGCWYYFEPEAGMGQGMLIREADSPES